MLADDALITPKELSHLVNRQPHGIILYIQLNLDRYGLVGLVKHNLRVASQVFYKFSYSFAEIMLQS